ncbi:kinase-like domain-containing protein [Xylariales sp. AK1849]|nr:kinase-like domain-containing protein [Xylariales sp. AK1849]
MPPEQSKYQPDIQSELRGLPNGGVRKSSIESSPVSWDDHLQATSAELGSGSLDPGTRQGSRSLSSVIDDYGDGMRFAQADQSKSRSHLRTQRSDCVLHSGAHLESGSPCPEPQRSYTPGQLEAELQGDDEASTENQDLAESIRAALIFTAGRDKKEFLPIDSLDKIITSRSVRQELDNLGQSFPTDDLDTATRDIWELRPIPRVKTSIKQTTRRKIFAVLVLLQKVETIVAFIKEGLHDSDLPFVLSEGSRKGLRQMEVKGKDGKRNPIQSFANWKIAELESFNHYQWQLLAPYFELNGKQNPKVPHYCLDSHTILPFIEDEENTHSSGGYGDVWRVKIHPAHHNGCEYSDLGKDSPALVTNLGYASQSNTTQKCVKTKDNPSYAVKRLRFNDHAAFQREVDNLKRFSGRDHLHLIKLLVTFEYCEQHYLLFPWADGNLLSFWKDGHPDLENPKRDRDLALWFTKQCLGIAEGLKMIHTANSPAIALGSHLAPPESLHGRHGDVKPENILWFKDYLRTDMGLLKISDFGGSRFNRTRSRSHVDVKNIPISLTYRAPEYDVMREVAQSYDIWSLGCVFLQFVTWYVQGWQGVDEFSKRRVGDDNSDIPEDVFFNFVTLTGENGQELMGARAKRSVADTFRQLYEDDDCPDFLRDFLDLIETDLLRMRPTKRAKVEDIVNRLRKLSETCINDQDYCTKCIKPPKRARTDLSQLAASPMNLSPEMGNRIRTSVAVPDHDGPLEDDTQTPDSEPANEETNDEGSVAFSRPRLGSLYTFPVALSLQGIMRPPTLKLGSSSSPELYGLHLRPQSPTKVHFQELFDRRSLVIDEHPDEVPKSELLPTSATTGREQQTEAGTQQTDLSGPLSRRASMEHSQQTNDALSTSDYNTNALSSRGTALNTAPTEAQQINNGPGTKRTPSRKSRGMCKHVRNIWRRMKRRFKPEEQTPPVSRGETGKGIADEHEEED